MRANPANAPGSCSLPDARARVGSVRRPSPKDTKDTSPRSPSRARAAKFIAGPYNISESAERAGRPPAALRRLVLQVAPPLFVAPAARAARDPGDDLRPRARGVPVRARGTCVPGRSPTSSPAGQLRRGSRHPKDRPPRPHVGSPRRGSAGPHCGRRLRERTSCRSRAARPRRIAARIGSGPGGRAGCPGPPEPSHRCARGHTRCQTIPRREPRARLRAVFPPQEYAGAPR